MPPSVVPAYASPASSKASDPTRPPRSPCEEEDQLASPPELLLPLQAPIRRAKRRTGVFFRRGLMRWISSKVSRTRFGAGEERVSGGLSGDSAGDLSSVFQR